MQGQHSRQSSFFGMIYERLLRRIAAAVDFSFVSEVVRDCYCPDNGRPSWNPLVLFKVVLLQFLYDLSGRQRKSRSTYTWPASGSWRSRRGTWPIARCLRRWWTPTPAR
jgi:hypothetical protein